MIKNIESGAIIVISVSMVLCFFTSVFGDSGKGLDSRLSLNIGWEQLQYEEDEPSTDTESCGRVNNMVLGVEGLKRWKFAFAGIKAVFPVYKGDDEEEWIVSGATYQTNTLEYGWTRVDGYLGYPLLDLLNPYLGLRWSEGRQDRTDFIVEGTHVSGSAGETISSRSFLLGVRGIGNLAPQWRWSYRIEYFVPVDVEVTNNALPGSDVSDKGGYTIEVKGGVEYAYSNLLSFGFLLYGGRMHWDGSGWKSYAGGRVKWPENNTDYMGGALNISCRF